MCSRSDTATPPLAGLSRPNGRHILILRIYILGTAVRTSWPILSSNQVPICFVVRVSFFCRTFLPVVTQIHSN